MLLSLNLLAELKKFIGLEMSSPTNIKLKAPLGFMSLLRGFIFSSTRISESKTFEYLDNDEEKTIPYPPVVFVLTSCGQLARYAFIDKRPEFENIDVLHDAPGINALSRNLQLKDFGAKSSQPQAPLPTIKAEISVTDLPAAQKTSTKDLVSGLVQGSQGSSIIPKQETNPLSITQKTTTLTQPGMSRQESKTTEDKGTIDPKVQLQTDSRNRIINNITSLKESYKAIGENIKDNVIKLLSEDNKKFYRDWNEIERRLYTCKEFLNKSKKFFVKQNFFNQNWNKFLRELEFEAGIIKEVVADQILEGEKLMGYRNTVRKLNNNDGFY